jgi:hypothetical protein
MKSFGLLRTNVGLTTNIKVMIDSKYNLSLDSIDSAQDLSLDSYKNVSFNKTNYYDELIPYFYKELPKDIAYQIKFDNDNDTMNEDFSNQYDEIYQYGARNIINNKNYSEEFEYFAPLYLTKKLPKEFIIFRIDGPGLGVLSKDSFKDDVLKKLKTVKLFNLTKETPLGEWLDINFINNQFFPKTPLEMDFRNLEFSVWNGIDYKSGGYISRSRFLEDIIDEEKEIFEFEKFIFDSYKDNGVVFPNILNLSFLFDDEPSTPDVKRKWSLNRYLGFYLDNMELFQTVSPYITPFLKNDVIIQEGNILFSNEGDPFIEGWSVNRPFYVEYKGNYYKVETFEESMGTSLQSIQSGNGLVTEGYQDVIVTKWRIISDVNLEGEENELNKNFGFIDTDNKLVDYDNNDIEIVGFDEADVWIIEVDGVYHNLISDNGSIKLFTDYSFEFNENDYKYKVAGVSKTINTVVDSNNPPKKFKIYKLKFSDIKDFDDRIVDTEYSKYEYEKVNELTLTDETKMYLENLLSNSNPKDLDDFIYQNEVVNIPVSSEYTANYETFKIENNDLSEIWRKNPVYCRWVYQNSLSANDYPYLLNNSDIFEDFNRTSNTLDPNPKRIERNLDYFYTINSSTSSYLHHSLHIEKLDDNGDIDDNFTFELDKYLNLATYSIGTSSIIATYSFDYFSSFFDRNALFNNSEIKKNVKKYSEFNVGDKSIPNSTLFRGIEFYIYDVESITLDDSDDVNNINLESSNKFDDYKFSILLSDNELSVGFDGNLDNSSNQMDWSIIDTWKMDKEYATGSIVIFDDVVYISNTNVITTNPIQSISNNQVKSAPYNQTEWVVIDTPYLSPDDNIFWTPDYLYSSGKVVYNNGDYYYYNGTGTEDFWNPLTASNTGYNQGDVVLFKGQYYMSMLNNNNYDPNYRNPVILSGQYQNYGYWVATQSSNPKWNQVELWNPGKNYNTPSYSTYVYVVHNEIVWEGDVSTNIEAGEEPGISTNWTREYSLEPDTDFVYPSTNPIISMNNRYYLCNSNSTNSTLDNGIVIYINKKWKNILVNINISDNTLPNIKGSNRDDMYDDLYQKLTAYNFIKCINSIDDKSDFTDNLSYVIIDEDGGISKYNYNNNITQLPYLIRCNDPDEFSTKVDSLKKTPISISNEISVNKSLRDGKILNISQLNYFNSVPVSATIIENKFTPKIFENYHGNKNIVSNPVFRFSGYYMPLFYDIQIFEKNSEFRNVGNYKFDITLTDFGMMKERKIRKVNRNGSILKLKDQSDIKSIYPMIDEFGYTFKDFFIFSSTWDYQYHVETIILNTEPDVQISSPTIVPVNIGQPSLNQIQNFII